ncbi:MAG: LPS export ABC transporter periplasmic protein LptC [Bacteroidia bacterium]|nr:LPS export ABC transporter periplasmic protein LptC [Bacteroidia bacterium]MDW8302593.1 LPS export ABC transporter periplasmic protein LptC [Bacteroidia bacterium]
MNTACRRTTDTFAENIQADSPIEIADSVEYTFSDSAKKRFYLTAAQVLTFEKKNKETKFIESKYRTFPKGVRVITYYWNGKEDIHLQANSGYWYETEQKIIGKNGVVLTNSEGGRLETDSLVYDQRAKKIYSDAPVKITTPTEIIEGIGFVANDNFTQYQIKNIIGTITLEK